MNPEKRIGADTSFVLRLLVGEPEAQARAAGRELDRRSSRGEVIAVSDLVIAETYHALQYHYEVPKQEALNTLKDFLEDEVIHATGVAAGVLKTPNLSRSNPGFVDRLIHADYLAEASGMLSFEKAAARLPQTEIPK